MKDLIILIKIIILCFFISVKVHAREVSDTFVVRIFGDRVKVISPTKYSKNLSVIVENKSYADLLGKVVTKQGQLIDFVSVPAESFKVVDLKNLKKGEEVLFVPLAPAFQEVELVVGREVYEIPPQRKNK